MKKKAQKLNPQPPARVKQELIDKVNVIRRSNGRSWDWVISSLMEMYIKYGDSILEK